MSSWGAVINLQYKLISNRGYSRILLNFAMLEAVLNCLKCSLRWKIFIFFPLLQSDSTAIFLGRSGRNWSFLLSTQRPNRGQSNLFGLPRWAAGKELALNLQTNNSKQLLRIAEKRSLKMHRLQFCRAKPPKGLVLTTELQRNYMCGALLGLPECKFIANKSKIASKRLA